MEIQRVDKDSFAKVFPIDKVLVYNSVEFADLNKVKCDDLHYLIFAEKKIMFGIVLGERGDRLYSPFSAPFGGFSCKKRKSLEHVDEAVKLLKKYGEGCGRIIELTLPPQFYDDGLSVKTAHSLMRHGRLVFTDINYHLILDESGADDCLDDKSRKKYKKSLKQDVRLLHLDANDEREIERTYNIIRRNREWHGYPLRMTLQNVIDTSKIVNATILIMTLDDVDVAAALIHKVSDKVAQVVYWGDAPVEGCEGMMCRFAVEVRDFCKKMGFYMLDIGPSSEFGIPSYGLCQFKESVGCIPSLKFRFEL